jgi:hypothetical protein
MVSALDPTDTVIDISATYIIKFSSPVFSFFFFCFKNPDDFSPKYVRINEGLLY